MISCVSLLSISLDRFIYMHHKCRHQQLLTALHLDLYALRAHFTPRMISCASLSIHYLPDVLIVEFHWHRGYQAFARNLQQI